MANSQNILDDMEFEQTLDKMGNNQPELLKFIAREQFQCNKRCYDHNKRITTLEGQGNKRTSFIGGGGALLGAFVAGLIDYFIKRGASG